MIPGILITGSKRAKRREHKREDECRENGKHPEQSTEDIKKLEQYIESNETFRQMQNTLSDKGYNLTGKGISGMHELTSDEVIRSIRGSKDEGYVRDVRECFMLCDLVKFAKYEPNVEDFNRVVEYARRIIA